MHQKSKPRLKEFALKLRIRFLRVNHRPAIPPSRRQPSRTRRAWNQPSSLTPLSPELIEANCPWKKPRSSRRETRADLFIARIGRFTQRRKTPRSSLSPDTKPAPVTTSACSMASWSQKAQPSRTPTQTGPPTLSRTSADQAYAHQTAPHPLPVWANRGRPR